MFEVDKRNKSETRRKRHFVLTGHFLEYKGSYAEQAVMVPSATGVVKLTFHSKRHKITVSM